MDLPASSRDRIARHRAAQRQRGLRPVVLWLPDVTDPAYRDRLAAECRRLARLTDDEAALASIRRLNAIVAATNGELVLLHDPDFVRGAKLAPLFYE